MLADIITTISKLGWDLVNGFKDIFVFIKDTTLSDALSIGALPWTEDIIEWLIDYFGWGDVTILTIIVGGGLSILVIATIVKWVIGIIM